MTSNFPKPLDGGGKIRDFHLLRWLSRDNDVTVVGFRDPELDERDAFLDFIPRERCHLLSEPRLLKLNEFLALRYLPRWCLSYFSIELQALIDQLIGSGAFDRVHISHSYMAWYLIPHIDTIPCVIDHHNVKSLFFENAYQSTNNWLKKIAYRAEALRWARYEQDVIPLFRDHYACSEQECRLIRNMTHQNVRLVPSGVDVEGFRLKSEEFTGTNLLFTGSLDYFPNTQGIEYFCTEVLPIVRVAVPEVMLQVVGKNPTLQVERVLENTDRVWYSYNVRDIRPFYYQSTVFVVPLLTGAGTRLKILEAMAVGLPVVSTSKGCDGLGLSKGQGIVIEDDPLELAAAIIRLLQDARYRQEMSAAASKACRERFSWDRIFETHLAS